VNAIVCHTGKSYNIPFASEKAVNGIAIKRDKESKKYFLTIQSQFTALFDLDGFAGKDVRDKSSRRAWIAVRARLR
jgi:hypothetical protein